MTERMIKIESMDEIQHSIKISNATVEELAYYLGITHTTLTNIKKGRNTSPHPQTMMLLSLYTQLQREQLNDV